MSIEVICPRCGKFYRVPDSRAGQVGKCSCGATMSVPLASVGDPTQRPWFGGATVPNKANTPVHAYHRPEVSPFAGAPPSGYLRGDTLVGVSDSTVRKIGVAFFAVVLLVVMAAWFGRPNADRELLEAAGKGSRNSIESILARGANVNARDAQGRTALMLLISRQDHYGTQALLRARPDINIRDNYGRTALHYAVMAHNTIAISAILSFRPNINVADNSGATPFSIACQRRNCNIPGMLQAYSRGATYPNYYSARVPIRFPGVPRAST
jgi:hypothetical protein